MLPGDARATGGRRGGGCSPTGPAASAAAGAAFCGGGDEASGICCRRALRAPAAGFSPCGSGVGGIDLGLGLELRLGLWRAAFGRRSDRSASSSVSAPAPRTCTAAVAWRVVRPGSSGTAVPACSQDSDSPATGGRSKSGCLRFFAGGIRGRLARNVYTFQFSFRDVHTRHCSMSIHIVRRVYSFARPLCKVSTYMGHMWQGC